MPDRTDLVTRLRRIARGYEPTDYGIAVNLDEAADEIERLRRSPSPNVRELVEGLRILADAADGVGIHYFDTDTLDPPVQDMQTATQAARALLSRLSSPKAPDEKGNA